MIMLKDSEFMAAKEKEQVLNQWERFLSNGFRWSCFNKSLYNHLIQHCQFIAHYNRQGFYQDYFENSDSRKLFLSQFKTGKSVEYGDSSWLNNDNYHDINSQMCQLAAPYTNVI